MIIHIVAPGETLESIAQQYGVTSERLMIDNEFPNPDNLVVGQSIGVRFPELVHTVEEGENLTSIAQLYDVTINRILQNNPWVAAEASLSPGDSLVIRFEQEGQEGSVIINGYCYPFIDREVLRKHYPF